MSTPDNFDLLAAVWAVVAQLDAASPAELRDAVARLRNAGDDFAINARHRRLLECGDCKQLWTDWRGEEARDEAVRKYRETLESKE